MAEIRDKGHTPQFMGHKLESTISRNAMFHDGLHEARQSYFEGKEGYWLMHSKSACQDDVLCTVFAILYMYFNSFLLFDN